MSTLMRDENNASICSLSHSGYGQIQIFLFCKFSWILQPWSQRAGRNQGVVVPLLLAHAKTFDGFPCIQKKQCWRAGLVSGGERLKYMSPTHWHSEVVQ